MTDLSPAAFAVVNAFVCVNARKTDPSSNADIAAALRAAVEQVLYEDKLGWTSYGYYTYFQNQILAIADELEAQ